MTQTMADMVQSIENTKTLLEQRWQIWRLKLDILMRTSVLITKNAVSREALVQVFADGCDWIDRSMCALSDVEPGNRFHFSKHEILSMCKDAGVPECNDSCQMDKQTQLLIACANEVLQWQRICEK